jgi:transmembrane sensor
MELNDNQKNINRIIERYVAGKATDDEIRFVEAYYQHLEKGEDVLETLEKEELDALVEENYQATLLNIQQQKNSKRVFPFYKYAAAVLILIGFASGFWYLTKDHTVIKIQTIANNQPLDVLPGVDEAILTLADGTKIVLDNGKNEMLVEKAGLTISKTKDGQLVYKVSNVDSKGTTVAYNTIETAKGNQYQILLPDGTKVWLNAASSLKYPEIFRGNERKVMLTGEAYFEVAKNKNMPFKVESNHQSVEVLGTHFNINSYMDDQTIKTTLIEGSIKVSNANHTKTLKPGEQSVINNFGLGNILIANNIDTEDEVAWKNGLFRFNNAGLKSILGQLERWYDVKIDYQSVPNKRYNGMVPRKAKLSEVLNMLELTGNISFKIEEGRNLKVLPK